MNSLTDQQLLRDYAERRSEGAFAELVRRHVDFVYSAARRMVPDAHLAEDVTQTVFVACAQKARQLADHPVLPGWLHDTARNLAAKVVRTEVRRFVREQEAVAMNVLLANETDPSWEQVAPQLDAAIGELDEADRHALLLRYFQRQSAREMAQTLGISDEAAQKRVSRAVDRLRELLAKGGVTVGAAGLVAAISVSGVQAAPIGLAATISTAASLAGTTIATTVTKAIIMTTLQKTLITAALVAAVGAGLYQTRQVANLRTQVQTLQQGQTQIAKLQVENERLSNQVAQTKDAQNLSKTQLSELMKLRNKSGLAQSDARELARLKSTPNPQTGFFTNAAARGLAMAEKSNKKNAQARLARMKKILKLTDEQGQAIGTLMDQQFERNSKILLAEMSGNLTGKLPDDQALERNKDDTEAEIKALFTADQLAAYPVYLQAEEEYQQTRKVAAARQYAKNETATIAEDFNLSNDQQGQLQEAFYQMGLNHAAEPAPDLKKIGSVADAVNLNVERQRLQLEEKLKVLGDFLSPEQLKKYRDEKTSFIDMQLEAAKMFPNKPTGK